MATPLSADRMLAALRAEGLHVVEHPGWRTHNRAGHGAWGPIHGVMIHHTGGTPPSDGQIVWAGRADLPGPCAHAYLGRDGTVTLTGNGRANHAGGGDPRVLQAVIDESYGDRPPAPHQHEGSAGAVDGNARFYGLEGSDLGTGTAWPAAEYDAAVRWAAAICRAHGWSAKSVIGHKEWSDWKPDPTFPMSGFRASVAARLAHPASWTPGAPTTEEDDVALTDADAKKIADAVWAKALVSPTAPRGSSPLRTAGTFLRWGDQHTAEILAHLAALSTAVQALARDGGLPLAQVQAAAEAGARAALAELGDTLTNEGA